MSQTGFQGKRLGEAARIWSEMVQQKGLTIFMGYAGSMSTTGQWKIVRWLIENRYIDVLVSTGANISEDIFEAMGHNYYQGTWMANDEDLLDAKIDRFYDIYADEYDYRELEALIKKFASTLDDEQALLDEGVPQPLRQVPVREGDQGASRRPRGGTRCLSTPRASSTAATAWR